MQRPQCRRRIRRAAADAGCHRQVLGERKLRARWHAGGGGQGACGTQHQVVRVIGERGGKGAVQGKRKVGSRQSVQRVADRGEDREAVEQVIAVGPAADEVQEQIDLGWRWLDLPGRMPGRSY